MIGDVIILYSLLLLEDLSKKYLFEWLIYVCHKTVIEDLSTDVRAPDDKFFCFGTKFACEEYEYFFYLSFASLFFSFL